MHDRIAWSLSLGRWRGVHVRVHMFFLLFVASAFFLNWRYAADRVPPINGVLWGSLAVLFVSVILHEIGHVWFARRHGGEARQIVAGPVGGMVPVHVPGDPAAEFRAHLAGPFVNLAICLICVPALMALGSSVVGLLNPLAPRDLTLGSQAEILLKLSFWINWCLLLVNLLPAFPLDGGNAMQSVIVARWPAVGPHRAAGMVARTAQVLAVGLLIAALLWRYEQGELLVPVRFAVAMLAIFLFFSARHRHLAAERSEESSWGEYEFSGSLAALEHDLEESSEPVPGPLRRWLQQRRQARLRRQQECELEEDLRVDEILARLHQRGMKTLTAEDRDVLERASARYRSRLGL